MWKDRKQGKRIIFHCSFCGKGKDQVEQLIAGPGGVYICNNCIHLCQQILQEKQTDREPETVAEMSSLLLLRRPPRSSLVCASPVTVDVPEW